MNSRIDSLMENSLLKVMSSADIHHLCNHGKYMSCRLSMIKKQSKGQWGSSSIFIKGDSSLQIDICCYFMA